MIVPCSTHTGLRGLSGRKTEGRKESVCCVCACVSVIKRYASDYSCIPLDQFSIINQ